MKSKPHQDRETTAITLSIEVPARVIRGLEGLKEIAPHMSVRGAISDYVEGCVRDWGRPRWDPQMVEGMSDGEIEAAIEELEAEQAARLEFDADDYQAVDVELGAAPCIPATKDPRVRA